VIGQGQEKGRKEENEKRKRPWKKKKRKEKKLKIENSILKNKKLLKMSACKKRFSLPNSEKKNLVHFQISSNH